MTPEQFKQIVNHGNALLSIFPNATERDPITLCKRLRRLESQGAAIAVRSCNGPEYAEGEQEAAVDKLLSKVNALLGNDNGGIPVHINLDPRGYALKIDDEYVRSHNLRIHRDWGGYGIIAPEITGRD